MSGIHNGHRERMREKFLKNGIDVFEEHEVLEMLLYYAVPRVNTNELAHELLRKFKSISGVFNAPIDLLTEFKGLSRTGATLLKLVPSMLRFYPKDLKYENFESIKDFKDFLGQSFRGETKECFKVCYLTNNLRLLTLETLAVGNVDTVRPDVSRIVEIALKYESKAIVISHNHPTAISLPSNEDIAVTRELQRALDMFGIRILDHIIVSGYGDVTSMTQCGYMSIL
ncbi:MAG: RadC family protein [Oscillospiraceae bacterium]|nr:RadC family protein [Oscillospiraceae bacterium]